MSAKSPIAWEQSEFTSPIDDRLTPLDPQLVADRGEMCLDRILRDVELLGKLLPLESMWEEQEYGLLSVGQLSGANR